MRTLVMAIMSSAESGDLKGWYCNLSRPAHLSLEANEISSDDLALDMWVDPAGHTLILDEVEFEALPIDEPTRAKVWRPIW